MKKLFLIFVLCALSLFGIMFCYADLQSNVSNTMEDLPLALKYESAESLKHIYTFNEQLQDILAQQHQSLNILNYIYYMGTYTGKFDGSGLNRSLKWDETFVDKAPLFNSAVYKGYYKARAEKILKQYQSSESFDYTAFIKVSRQEFDSYMNGILKDPKSKEELLVAMQSKLSDKLVELEPAKRKAAFDEILSLRQVANSSKAFDHIFQLFESRVRLQLTRELIELNKQKLDKLVQRVGIVISSEAKGQLLLQSQDMQSADKAVIIINVLENQEGYRGLTFLHELYDKQDYLLIFAEEQGSIHEIELEKAIANIELDENGYVHLNLDALFLENVSVEGKTSSVQPITTDTMEKQMKSSELLYASKTKASQAIIRELNRYSMYLELKERNISNYFTKSFEGSQKLWKSNLDKSLNAFGISGMADFMAYIKHFELMDRSVYKENGQRILIAKFRNSDLQFRKTEEGSFWITNMLFQLKTMQ